MTSAAQLLVTFHQRGIELRAEGDNIVLRPKSSLTPALRAQLLACKPEVLALLKTNPELGSPSGPRPDLQGVALTALATGSCYACGGVVFWKLRGADELVCATCHPPGPPDQQIEWRRGRDRG